MDIKLISALACVLLASAANADNGSVVHKYTAAEYLRNFALSRCIADGFPEDANIYNEAIAVSGGYLEFGSYPIEAYEEAADLGKEFLKREYSSKSGATLTLMKCIDFYHSKELSDLTEKYSKK